ncbi:DUF3472 domain-containing protein [Burkholderia pseudomallei]|uniref:DUF3472 domain-containing protein n=1 Tax=Burkholderia pseudomallei TaxID=28450 RepID=UPI000537B296|nr:DUF3472 domain-containing protein [Burkholderia pseudomallei]KGW18070.1 hypothetical protein X980_5996 [Burkholderia pseudomallei MSHR4000]MBF3523541.1 DUF3472 domain-containing protein [Burkholderia pseudomallei]MBF3540387.1 DUF3472 domain-containing protein [Burkholderia pseudomallei]MBF3602575.1 DUF3472 domain-containing protein [Burkholderia pseudomallei]CRY44925.1 Domain of uncharacterised function (DUF3472) [Burkholderia pseudomallei]
MKKTAIAMIGVLSLVSSVSEASGSNSTQYGVHVVNFFGNFKEKPPEGFRNLTYPINILYGPNERKLYYAQYVMFNEATHGKGAFYYGIQPQGGGEAFVLFSFFGKNARVVDAKHCSEGADGGEGVTCNTVKIKFKFGVIYDFSVELVGEGVNENIWEGSVFDTSTREKIKIGSWATPKSIGYLSGLSSGFIEDFVGVDRCSDIPATSAYFGPGVSQIAESRTAKGTIDSPFGVGVCNGKVKFSSESHDDGGRTITQERGVD